MSIKRDKWDNKVFWIIVSVAVVVLTVYAVYNFSPKTVSAFTVSKK